MQPVLDHPRVESSNQLIIGKKRASAYGNLLSLTLANFELVHGVRGTLNVGSFSTIS